MIVIVNCGSNIASVEFALDRLKKKYIVSTDTNIIKSASHVILPGVGHATYGMQQLKKNNLISVICSLKQPVLGICLGMHLLCQFSSEGNVQCLEIFPNKILPFPKKPGTIIPHMGWNQLHIKNHSSSITNDIKDKAFVYFVHSYYAPIENYTIASTEYEINFSAIFQYKNFIGMQFHPEKSGKIGKKLLYNFLEMKI